jgi:LytS/YehU family sensor histidine kinase
MILQPLIENAVKFGTGGPGSQGGIRLRVSGEEQEVLICLSNPFDPVGERFRGEGLGLKNVRNRLRLLYGNGQLLTVRVEGQVFHACLRLPRSLPADAGERPVRGAETPSDEKKEHSHE